MNVADWNYLIIGGAYKGGTTAFFYYLARHSRIVSATVKETRFFLEEHAACRKLRHYTEGIEVYNTFFPPGGSDALRMEATPFYLYSPGCADRLADALPRARMVFSLRNPVDRFVSSFRYGKQIGVIPADMLFSVYVAQQQDAFAADPNRIRALSMGCYARFLTPFIERFGRDRVCVVLSEDLRAAPQKVLEQVCRFVGLPAEALADRPPAAENITRDHRTVPFPRQWNAARFALSRWTYQRPALHAGFRKLKHRLEKRLATHRQCPVFQPDPESLEQLKLFYREESKQLRALDVQVDWPG